MPTIVKPIGLAAVLLALGACSKLGIGGQDEMTWARAALDRNDRVQVVASDPQAKTFTVRVKDTGQLIVIPLDQVVAGPTGFVEATQKAQAVGSPGTGAGTTETPSETAGAATSPPASASSAAELPAAAGAAGGASQAPGSPALASAGEAAQPGRSAPPAQAAAPTQPAAGSGSESALAEDQSSAVSEGPHAESAANAKAGSVLASGPGYSIKAAGSKAGPARASPVTAARGAPERLHDPIICQGSRLLHIDNRNLEFDGDAITAEDGCEIHITNTHISAKGIGVLARAANVHISNSEIDGASGAVEASDGAQVYAESSRFKGLTRRLESSAFHDLGGNVWN